MEASRSERGKASLSSTRTSTTPSATSSSHSCRAHRRAVDERTVRRVLKIIASIPRGTTLSYGQVADRAGLRSARLVGKILADTHDDIPWHRVVRSDGTPTPH